MRIVQTQSVDGLVRELLKQPESATLEFKRYTIDQSVAAKILLSFANAKGGYLIVGADEHAGVVGCDIKKLRRVIDVVIQNMAPPARIAMHEAQIDGKDIALVRVEPSPELVMIESGARRTSSLAEDAYQALVGIVTSKELRIGRFQERIDVTLPELERLGIGPNKIYNFKESTRPYLFAPVCWLADIPVRHLGYHANRYGKIAIGYHRESVVRAGFSPVFDQLQNSMALQSLFQTLLGLDSIGGLDPPYDFMADEESREKLPDEPYEQFIERMRKGALTHARENAATACAFIKTFDASESPLDDLFQP